MRDAFFGNLPQSLETGSSSARVMSGVPRIAVSKIILDQPQVVSLVRQSEAAGMPQHVWMDVTQTGTFSGRGQNVIHRLPCHRLFPLGNGVVAQH